MQFPVTNKAILFGVFVTYGTRTAMERANALLEHPVKDSTLRTWFNRWRKFSLHVALNRLGKY